MRRSPLGPPSGPNPSARRAAIPRSRDRPRPVCTARTTPSHRTSGGISPESMRSRTARNRRRSSANGSASPGCTQGAASRTTRTVPAPGRPHADRCGPRALGSGREPLGGPFRGKDHRHPISPRTSLERLHEHRAAPGDLRLDEADLVPPPGHEVEVIGGVRVRIDPVALLLKEGRGGPDDLFFGDPGRARCRGAAHGPLLRNQRSRRDRGIPSTIGRPWGQE